MLSQFILLFLINSLSAIGYSLIAPLFPFEAYAKGVNEFMIGLIFSSFAISNVISFPLTPMLIKRIGRRNLFYIAMTIEATCTISFGLVSRIEDKNLFIIISIATRFLQGIGSALSSTLVYSIAASLCEEENIKTTMGYMELAYSVGLTIGPVLAAVLYYFFSYSFPFYICGILTLNCIPFIGDLDIPDDENDLDHPPMFSLLLNWGILFTFLAIIVDMVSGTFIYPVFTTHLNATYGIGVELSSLFFVIMMVSYFITLQFLNDLSEKLGTKLTITLGLTINCFAVLLLAPVKFMPQ